MPGEALPVYSPFYDPDAPLPPALAAELDAANALGADGSPVLAVVCVRFYAPYFKRMAALRRAGVKTVLVTLLDKMSHSISLKGENAAFDAVVSAEGHGGVAFIAALARLRARAAHIISLVKSSSFPALAAACLPMPLTLEYVDLLTSIHSRESLAQAIGADEADTEWACERFVLEKCRGMLSKSTPEATDRMFAFHGLRRPVLEFYPYPSPDSSGRAEPEEDDGPVRLVSIGGVHGGGPSRLLNPTIDIGACVRSLGAQGLHFQIFNPYDPGDDPDFDWLRQLAATVPGFAYAGALHPDSLTATISRFDAGWFVEDYRIFPYDRFYFESSTSSRFFDYIDAGLPIVIVRDLAFMARLVAENDIGYVIDFKDLPHVGDIVTRQGLREKRRNVAALRERLAMDRQIPRLLEFSRQTVGLMPEGRE
jgi:hypothetical protein